MSRKAVGCVATPTVRDSLPIYLWQILRMHRHPAGDAQQPTGLLDLDGSIPSSYVQKRGRPLGRPLFWYTGRDSNPQPSEPESDALSIEPPVHLLYSLCIIASLAQFVKRSFTFFIHFFSPVSGKVVVFPGKV